MLTGSDVELSTDVSQPVDGCDVGTSTDVLESGHEVVFSLDILQSAVACDVGLPPIMLL